MPKTFEEFTTQDMEQIRKQIETVIDLNRLLGVVRSVRIDSNREYFVLEYKRQSQLALSVSDYNNPDASVNIRNDFSMIILGFENQDETLINRVVHNYLKSRDFAI